MIPIARRIQIVLNDARQSGHRPVEARISPADDRQLEMWLRQQSRSIDTGLPARELSRDNLFGVKVVADPKVSGIIQLKMQK